MKINNKDVIQSYLLTTAKYDFSVYEKRILYRLVETLQDQLDGKKLDKNFSIEPTLFKDMLVRMPTSAFLNGELDENHTRVKKALSDLRNKTFEYEDEKTWSLIGIIEKPVIDKRGYVEFEVQPKIYEAILNFSKGFRKFELKTAMEFESAYSMRFYELLSGQQASLNFSIEKLKIMFDIAHKYPRPSDFIKRVVDVAKKELDKLSPYSFEYSKIKEGKKITALRLHPYKIAANRDPELEKHQLQKQVSLGWDLDKHIVSYLRENFAFSNQEIKNNIDLFKKADKELDLLLILSKNKAKCNEMKNPKAYLIGILKKILK